MKIGTIILCRYSSTRLPGKILKELNGKPVLSYLYEKFERIVKEKGCVLVCTSTDPSDDIIAEFCKAQSYNCYRGDLHNVAKRFLDASKAYNYDYAVRINGDALFVDIETYEEMIEICQKADYDFISNVKGRSFPFGMSVEIVKTDFFEKIQPEIQAIPKYREHVTLYLYEHLQIGKQFHHFNTKCPDLKGLQIALDEPKDLELFKRVMNKLKDDYYTCDLIKFHKIIETIQHEFELEGKAWTFINS